MTTQRPDLNKNDITRFFKKKHGKNGEHEMKKFKMQKYLTGNASFLTPFQEAENRFFSISCLVSATELTQITKYGKVHWLTLNLF